MAERYTRRSALLAVLEATYGVVPAGFNATDAILLAEPPRFQIEPDNVPRNLALPWMGNSEELPATRRAKLNFKVEMVGSGAAGTAPVWGKLLRACGFAEVITAGQRVVYTPVNTGFESLSFRFYRDGVRYVARGGRGMVKFDLSAYAVPTLEFEFWAFDTTALGENIPAIDVSAQLTPEVVTDANSGDVRIGSTLTGGVVSGGTVLPSRGITWDAGNKLAHKKLLGGEKIEIVDRAVSGQIAVDLDAAQEIAWRTEINAVTLASLSFQHGSVSGKQINVFAPRVQRTNPQAIDYEGNILIQSDLRALPGNTGAPELTIISR